MSHPNVVSIFDVGPHEDSIFIAMELVDGRTLRQWLQDEPAASWRDIVEVFEQAGRGLAAAHDRGLIHRDFKPDNVMVGADGRVRVMDFGLAQLDGGVAESTGDSSMDMSMDAVSWSSLSGDVLTATGCVLGTPAYMAPQALMGGKADARSDQYSFCVALHEALYGGDPSPRLDRRAFGGDAPPPVCGTDGRPVRPGCRRSSGSTGPCVSASGAIRLDAGTRRRSARAPHHSTTACAGVVGGACAVPVLLWGLADADRGPAICEAPGVEMQWDDARRDRIEEAMRSSGLPYAANAWEHVASAGDRFVQRWEVARSEGCEAPAKSQGRSADLRWACLHRARTRFDAALAEIERGGPDAVVRVHALVDAVPDPARCSHVATRSSETPTPDVDQAPAVASLEFELATANATLVTGRRDAARQHLDRAHRLAEDVDYEPAQVELLYLDALVLLEEQRAEDAELTLLEALTRASALHNRDTALRSAVLLATLYAEQFGRFEEGARYLQVAEEIATAAGESPAVVEMARGHLSMLAGDYPRAEAAFGRARAQIEAEEGPNDHRLVKLLVLQSRLLRLEGKTEEAKEAAREAIERGTATLGAAHPETLTASNNLATAQFSGGEAEDAETLLRSIVETREEVSGPHHQETLIAKNNLAVVVRARGDQQGSADLQREVLEGRIETLGESHPLVAQSRGNLAAALEMLGEAEEAEALLREAVASLHKSLGPDHPELAKHEVKLASTLSSAQQYGEAQGLLERALPVTVESLGPHHPDAGFAHQIAGYVQAQCGRFSEARDHYAAAVEAYRVRDPRERGALARAELGVLEAILEGTEVRSTAAEHLEAVAENDEARGRRIRAWLDPNRPLPDSCGD